MAEGRGGGGQRRRRRGSPRHRAYLGDTPSSLPDSKSNCRALILDARSSRVRLLLESAASGGAGARPPVRLGVRRERWR